MHFAAIALHLDYISSRWRVIKRDFVHLEIRIHKTEQKMRRKMWRPEKIYEKVSSIREQ